MAKTQITKAVSAPNTDTTKDLLKCIYLHQMLVTDKNSYPSRWTIQRKWNKILSQPDLQDYLDANEGKLELIQSLYFILHKISYHTTFD